MGQKVSPNGLRLGINKYWQSRWFSSKEYAKFLNEDIRIRNVLEDQLANAGIARIEIERAADEIKVDVYTSKPGVVIGKRAFIQHKLNAFFLTRLEEYLIEAFQFFFRAEYRRFDITYVELDHFGSGQAASIFNNKANL